jgi:hypothetical protein
MVHCFQTSTAAGRQAYHVGLDFLESSASSPRFLFGFEPYAITSPGNHFVTQGGLSGWSEDQTRRAVALAVDAAFRDIDVGDPNRTTRIAIYVGPAAATLAGQRLNIAMGQSSSLTYSLLGENGGVYNDPLANDAYVAAVYVDEIDKLGSELLTYDTAAGVINAIAGTTAHEIGHVFGLSHVSTTESDSPPLPVMATFQTGLAWEDRLEERRFSEMKPTGTSNADLIYLRAGTVPLGDLNLDTLVDTQDAQIMFANWGLENRLYHEGDINGDQWIDARDAGIMFANWNGAPPTEMEPLASTYALGFESHSSWEQNNLAVGVSVPEPASFTLAAIVLLVWVLLVQRLASREVFLSADVRHN